MSIPEHLAEIMKAGNLTMYGLGKALKLKSTAHVWLWMHGGKKPGIDSSVKIVKLAQHYGINLTLDKLWSEKNESGN